MVAIFKVDGVLEINLSIRNPILYNSHISIQILKLYFP